MENTNQVDQKGGNGKMAWVVAIIVLIGVVVALNNVEKKPKSEALEAQDTAALNEEAPASPVVLEADPDQALPYTKAAVKYAGSELSFDSRCVASPTRAEFENGSKIMLDNRGSQPITLRFGDYQLAVPAYNFVFYTLQEEELPAVYAVSCGDVKDVARITIVK